MDSQEQTKKDALISIRCTISEKDVMNLCAIENGESISEWGRRILVYTSSEIHTSNPITKIKAIKDMLNSLENTIKTG